MNLFSFLAFTVYATEAIISPLPDPTVGPSQPTTSFAQLIALRRINGQVLGITTTISPSPTPSPKRARKSNFTIAVLGDSMVDTLGPNIPHLKTKLEATYPGSLFRLINYGVGATNIDYGMERITHDYTYLGRSVPSLISQHPDVIVIESFAYNPYPEPNGAIDRHWLALAKIIDVLKGQIPGVKIVIAATIAPNATVFGDGAPGVSFAADDKKRRADVIKKYLESTVKFAQSQHLPFADAYHPSLQADGNGNATYINAGDHIHYSDAGRILFASKVTDAIVNNHILE